MTFKYRKELFVILILFFVCGSIVCFIKNTYFKDIKSSAPINSVFEYYNVEENKPKFKYATTKEVPSTIKSITTVSDIRDDEVFFEGPIETEIPYQNPPAFVDDGSIIYDGMTITELTNKLNRSLNGYLTNTGYFFAEYTKNTGMDPYLSVAIVLLETGCKWTCSSLTVRCNNIGGLKGGASCNGSSYSRYDTLDDGIAGYLGILYNNYYLKGMVTADAMASTYAASPLWAAKVNRYIEEIKNS